MHNLTCELEEKIGEDKRDGELKEPEIRVDVYRPTSKSSSLTYNKKYIRSVGDTDLPVIATNISENTKEKTQHKMLSK